ncbi:uncharacterized protein LOC111701394 [Eurytemora carolleeae]|uniref:uncharacterized protein LOC111701394 n=1 Tax=Eurytemora carolleeae TaxID=1294199 RepID=UPI000C78AADB|nr:uncharacterized protein LOC111701394 [Eurytemora carolleeae]XP_023328437.1 uncharacterized protein LOC111701394 [Eurytemora carolleeae]|eukprot:XP_023328436.1 uncharacterized protein LOC111701394 [Eurytemora affinis]
MENLTEKEDSPSSYLEETPAQKLTLNAAVLQERVAIIKFPYSDLSTIPSEMPRKAVYNSVISIPQDIRELIRLLQRCEQLSTPMNLQLNMNDTELGQKILTAIKQVCAEQKEEITGCQVPEKQSWKTVIKKSVSFLSGGGGDGLDTFLVPLATSEVYEDKDETSV